MIALCMAFLAIAAIGCATGWHLQQGSPYGPTWCPACGSHLECDGIHTTYNADKTQMTCVYHFACYSMHCPYQTSVTNVYVKTAAGMKLQRPKS